VKNVIEFWYEFASTYSYPAAMRAEAVAAKHGVRVAWRPFLLGAILRDIGLSTSPFNEQPAKGAYMWRDLERICALQGLAFVRPDPFPQNSLLAARVAMALPDDGARSAFSRAVYDAEFASGAGISDPDVVSGCLTQAGLDAESVLAHPQSNEVKAALRDQTDQARAHGIFGAPTWRTPDDEVFWGNDRLEDALDWMQRAPV
jgi:2-hydroxychromene-2-carboxylate isomerase